MYITMLTKRTTILLDLETYNYLDSMARRENASLAKIIRTAIDKVYKETNQEETIIKKRMAAFNAIVKMRKKIKPLKNITYRQLIEDGRTR